MRRWPLLLTSSLRCTPRVWHARGATGLQTSTQIATLPHTQTIVGRELKKFLDMSETSKIGYQVGRGLLHTRLPAC